MPGNLILVTSRVNAAKARQQASNELEIIFQILSGDASVIENRAQTWWEQFISTMAYVQPFSDEFAIK